MARRDRLTSGDLVGQSLITLSTFDYPPGFFDDLLRRILHRSGRKIQTFTTYMACELARHGLGIAMVDALTAKSFQTESNGLCVRQLDEDPTIQISLISSKAWPRNSLADQFMKQVRDRSATTMHEVGRMLGA